MSSTRAQTWRRTLGAQGHLCYTVVWLGCKRVNFPQATIRCVDRAALRQCLIEGRHQCAICSTHACLGNAAGEGHGDACAQAVPVLIAVAEGQPEAAHAQIRDPGGGAGGVHDQGAAWQGRCAGHASSGRSPSAEKQSRNSSHCGPSNGTVAQRTCFNLFSQHVVARLWVRWLLLPSSMQTDPRDKVGLMRAEPW